VRAFYLSSPESNQEQFYTPPAEFNTLSALKWTGFRRPGVSLPSGAVNKEKPASAESAVPVLIGLLLCSY
jgi:hypothetical protein